MFVDNKKKYLNGKKANPKKEQVKMIDRAFFLKRIHQVSALEIKDGENTEKSQKFELKSGSYTGFAEINRKPINKSSRLNLTLPHVGSHTTVNLLQHHSFPNADESRS